LHLLQFLGKQEQKWWMATNLVSVFVLSMSLSIYDHLLTQANRRIPTDLIQKGYLPNQTWYYGKLSIDYYMYQKGFQKLRVSKSGPSIGDFVIHEVTPPDFEIQNLLPGSYQFIPVDTLRYYKFPLRTRKPYGGFYGESRLPYFLDWTSPVREIIVYQIK